MIDLGNALAFVAPTFVARYRYRLGRWAASVS
jgi:hypothetical protein